MLKWIHSESPIKVNPQWVAYKSEYAPSNESIKVSEYARSNK